MPSGPPPRLNLDAIHTEHENETLVVADVATALQEDVLQDQDVVLQDDVLDATDGLQVPDDVQDHESDEGYLIF